jgi:hypothetical protein
MVAVGAWFGCRGGLKWVAIGVAAAVSIHALNLGIASARASGVGLGRMLAAHRQGLAHAALLAGSAWPLAQWLRSMGNALLELCGVAVVSCVLALIAARLFPRIFSERSWPVIGEWTFRNLRAAECSMDPRAKR